MQYELYLLGEYEALPELKSQSEDNPIVPEQRNVLDRIQAEFNITPMESPFEYVKAVQTQFDDALIFEKNITFFVGENGTESLLC